MAQDANLTYLSILRQMRGELVQTRRSNTMDNNLSGVIGAQERLDLIDRAIADETQLGKSAQAQTSTKKL